MRYWGPLNSPGGIYGNDGYVDGNPAIGQQGSIPTFRTFEQMMRELQTLVVASEFTPDDVLNGKQVAQSVQRGKIVYAVDTGTANSLVVTLNLAPVQYGPGFLVHLIKGPNTNKAPGPTLNVNGLGPTVIVQADGSEIRTGGLQGLCYAGFIHDGTNFRLFAGGGVGITDPWRTHPFYGFYATAKPGYNNISGVSPIGTMITQYGSFVNTLKDTTWDGAVLTLGEGGFYMFSSGIETNLPVPGTVGTVTPYSWAQSISMFLNPPHPKAGAWWSYGGLVAEMSYHAFKGPFSGFAYFRYMYPGEKVSVWAGQNSGTPLDFPTYFSAVFLGK